MSDRADNIDFAIEVLMDVLTMYVDNPDVLSRYIDSICALKNLKKEQGPMFTWTPPKVPGMHDWTPPDTPYNENVWSQPFIWCDNTSGDASRHRT